MAAEIYDHSTHAFVSTLQFLPSFIPVLNDIVRMQPVPFLPAGSSNI